MKTYIVKGILSLLAIFSLGCFRIVGQCNELYGITFEGGEFNAGTIFKTDGNGDNFTSVYSFFQYMPSVFCKSSNGKFYGLNHGGQQDEIGFSGAILEFDPAANTYIKKIIFRGVEMGTVPVGTLTEANNGKFYGIMRQGGKHDVGVIFEWDPSTNQYSKKFDFDWDSSGAYPGVSLFKADNGNLYGTTLHGGLDDDGVLFEWDADSNTYTKLVDFNGEETGSRPSGTLMQADNGKLYGTTSQGGLYGMGVLYEWDPVMDSLTKKIDFNGAEKGEYPEGPLTQANNGKIYGTTTHGGIYGHNESQGWFSYGVLFEWDPVTNIYTKILDFDLVTNGGNPDGNLVQACNGKLYGRIGSGGQNHLGVLFELDPVTDCFTKRFDFDSIINMDKLILIDNCSFFTVSNNTVNSSARFIEWDPVSNNITTKLEIARAENGMWPVGQMILANNKKLYGMTYNGGLNNSGVLFEWDPVSDIYSKKMDFNVSEKGSSPEGSLVKADNGKLYGMTSLGGVYKNGVLFEWDPASGIYTKKLDFNGAENGGLPHGSLIQANNGKLYGMTPAGGEIDEWGFRKGLLFEWDPVTNIFSKKFDFNESENGKNPTSSLVEAINGKLYGTTTGGGKHDRGVLFEWDPITNMYSKKLDFSQDSGNYPQGSLIQANNGKLYGMTSLGGLNGAGVIFEWDPLTDTFAKKIDFTQKQSAGRPYGSIIQAPNGKMYGMYGFGNGNGVLFEWDPVTNIYTEKEDTIVGMGGFYSGGLVKLIYSTSDTIYAEVFESYTSPSGKYTWTTSGLYNDTIPSAAGCDSVITVNLTINNITGLESNTFKPNITLYPNPTNGLFTIDLGKTYPNAEIAITLLDGRIIRHELIMNARFKDFQLPESPGLYLVSITSGNERTVFKLSKK